MLQPNTFLGSPMILHSVKSEEKKSLRRKFDEIEKLFLYRYKIMPIKDVLDSLKSLMFSLRIEVAIEVTGSENKYADYLKTLDSVIVRTNQKSFISTLAKRLADILNDYHDLVSATTQIVRNVVEDNSITKNTLEKSGVLNMSYEQFNGFVAMSPVMRHFDKYLDASLVFDLATCMADEVINGKIPLSSDRVKNELIPALETSLIDFGKYSILLGFFSPTEEAHHYGRFFKMKILASSINAENKANLTKIESQEDLSKMFSL